MRYASAHAQSANQELSDALARREIRFEGAAVPLAEVPARLAREGRAAARSEIAARWLDELPACDPVLEARLADFDSAATELGFDSFSALRRGSDVDTAEAWEDSARTYLSLTAESYRRSLPHHITRFAPGTDLYRPAYADSLFFERLPHADRLFPTGALAAAYRNTLAALRLPEETIALNVRNSPERTASVRFAAAFAVDPPTIVQIEARSVVGFDAHRSLLLAAGRAQHLAWSSSELRARHPEFICPAGDDGAHDPAIDDPTRRAHGEFFAALLCDAAWLAETRGLRIEEARTHAHDAAFAEVFRCRRAAARLLARADYNLDADDDYSGGRRDYVELMTEATGFAYDPRLRIKDVLDGDDPLTEFRATLFVAGLRDALRTRHGSRWWTRGAARDDLIDMWNTGTRYTPEELAQATGIFAGGAFDAEALAAAHLVAMRDPLDA